MCIYMYIWLLVNSHFFFSEIQPCNDTELIRLSPIPSNDSNTLGRLEICYDGYWGSICDYSPDGATADVACRDLGYKKGYMWQ